MSLDPFQIGLVTRQMMGTLEVCVFRRMKLLLSVVETVGDMDLSVRNKVILPDSCMSNCDDARGVYRSFLADLVLYI